MCYTIYKFYLKGEKHMKKLRRVIALFAAAAMMAASIGCSKEVTAEDLMVNIQEGNASEPYVDDTFCECYSIAAFNLLKNEYSQNGSNVVLSPLAVYYNLSMLTNGATGQTKDDLQNMFSRRFFSEQLNSNMHSFDENLKDTDKSKLYFENALWFNSDKNIQPSEDFLVTAKTYYHLDAYRETFSEETVKNINNWASNKTNMYSERILKEMPTDVPLYLTNTTLLEADWEAPVSPANVFDAKFKTSSGTEQDVQMMSSVEKIYIGDEYMEGFIKKYSGGNYAFLAMVPKNANSTSLETLLSSLTRDSYYRQLIKKRKDYLLVDACLPKFSCAYNGEIKNMMEKANLGGVFNSQYCDLEAIGTCSENLYLGNMAVSTGLNVTESGTNRGTGANVGNFDGSVNMIPVNLNRPFVFAVVDTKRYLPVIVGAVNAVKE